MDLVALPSGRKGQRPEPPASNEADQVKAGDQQERVDKKRKQPRKKTPNKAPKRSKSQHKALKPSVAVKGAVKVNAPNHGGVKANVGVGSAKAGQESKKKGKKKPSSVVRKKKKSRPADSRKTVGAGNLKPALQAPADNVLGDEGGQGFDGPREGDKGGGLGQLGGAKAEAVHKEIAHDGHGALQEKAQREVAQEHVQVALEVGESTLINWEHFSLVYEEYCLTKEVNKSS